MTTSYLEPQLMPDELTLRLIASGVIQLSETVKNGQSVTLPYPRTLQRGLDRLVLKCLNQCQTPPQGVPELLDWCRRPLSKWPLELPEDAGIADTLLDGQIPTSICEEWAIASADIEAELTQQQLLLNVMQVCSSLNAPEAYVAFRYLLINKPVLTEVELLQRCIDPVLEPLAEQIHTAYEQAPDSCAVEGYFYCCAHCDNLMLRTDKGDLICVEERCRRKGSAKSDRPLPQKQRVLWLKRGLRRFIAAPGRAELRLAEKLEKLSLTVELWPNFDKYDLRIEFPDREAWAIDVKDWANPFLLAQKVKQQNPMIPSQPSWNKAYFVFPDDRKVQRTDYLRAFLNHCPLPKPLKAKFETEFIKDVKNKLRRCK